MPDQNIPFNFSIFYFPATADPLCSMNFRLLYIVSTVKRQCVGSSQLYKRTGRLRWFTTVVVTAGNLKNRARFRRWTNWTHFPSTAILQRVSRLQWTKRPVFDALPLTWRGRLVPRLPKQLSEVACFSLAWHCFTKEAQAAHAALVPLACFCSRWSTPASLCTTTGTSFGFL